MCDWLHWLCGTALPFSTPLAAFLLIRLGYFPLLYAFWLLHFQNIHWMTGHRVTSRSGLQGKDPEKCITYLCLWIQLYLHYIQVSSYVSNAVLCLKLFCDVFRPCNKGVALHQTNTDLKVSMSWLYFHRIWCWGWHVLGFFGLYLQSFVINATLYIYIYIYSLICGFYYQMLYASGECVA